MAVPVLDDAVQVELELPARPEVVAIARMVVVAFTRDDPAFDDERIADIRLAVSEACTNAVEAHLDHAEPTPIVIRCWSRPGHLQVAIRDRGGGFEVDEAVRSVDLTQPARLQHEGGLGLPLIRLLADEADFRRLDRGTEVVMSFGPESVTGRIGE